MADTRDQLQLPEIDLLTKVVKDFEKSTTSIFDDIENIFPTAPILDKQKDKEQVIVTPDAGMGKLLKLNENLLEVTENEVVGSIEELTELFKDGIPMDSGKGAAPAVDLGASFEEMLQSIQSIEKGSDFTQRPEFLQFMEEQNEQASELLKGTEEERAIAFEMLAALGTLREDNKESINTLMKQQADADKKRFQDVGGGLFGPRTGIGDSIKTALIAGVTAALAPVITPILAPAAALLTKSAIGIGKFAAQGAAVIGAGLAGWAVGSIVEEYMNENWQIRDKFADAMDSIVETFPSASDWLGVASSRLELGKQVLTPEEMGSSPRVQARLALLEEAEARLGKLTTLKKDESGQFVPQTELRGEARAAVIEAAQKRVKKLNEEIANLFSKDSTRVITDSAEVLAKQRELGRAGATRNIEKGMDNRTHQVFREEIVRDRQPAVVQPQTSVIPIPAPPQPRPAPQKQIDDWASPTMHLFLQ